jgi:plasmid stabilization system protein ParE
VANYVARPQVDEDLVTHARWIELDNPDAARRFLETAFKSFEFLASFPEAGPKARFKHERLKDVRFWVLPPPFNRWLVFYTIDREVVTIIRVLHSSQNWREQPEDLL